MQPSLTPIQQGGGLSFEALLLVIRARSRIGSYLASDSRLLLLCVDILRVDHAFVLRLLGGSTGRCTAVGRRSGPTRGLRLVQRLSELVACRRQPLTCSVELRLRRIPAAQRRLGIGQSSLDVALVCRRNLVAAFAQHLLDVVD